MTSDFIFDEVHSRERGFVSFFALGGTNENGKNSYVLKIERDIFIINSGTMVPLNTSLGVDTVMPKIDYLIKNNQMIKAIIITDVKDESFSALPWYLRQLGKIPVYASNFSLARIRDRLKSYNFLEDEFILRELPERFKINDIEIRSFDVAGALPGQRGLNFNTIIGNFTVILNCFVGETFLKTDLNYIKEGVLGGRGARALFLDSGLANLTGRTNEFINLIPKIEEELSKDDVRGRVIFSCYDEDLFTIHQIMKLAKKRGKEIFVYGLSTTKMYEWAKENLSLNDDQNIKISPLTNCKDSKDGFVIITSTVGRLFIRLRRIVEGQDVILRTRPDDILINMAMPINGLEVYSTHTLDIASSVVDRLIDLQNSNSYRYRSASGDIEEFVRILRPETFVPIQGLYRYMLNALKIAGRSGVNKRNIPILSNGKIITWDKEGFELEKEILKEIGNVYIDNVGYSIVGERTLKEREQLSKGGLVAITGLVSVNSKRLLSDIKVKFCGVFTSKQRIEVVNICNKMIKSAINELGPSLIHYKNIQRLKNSIRRKLQRIFEKEPVIVINLYQIAKG